MSEKVRSWFKARGIKYQYDNVETPHQIAIAERNHGILLSMMRAMMALLHAPKSMWAAALIYAAFLCNHMASEYKVNATAQIPYMSLGMTYMREFMFPFGCLVWIHKSKQKVEDGKLDVRAIYAIYIGVGMTQGVKGIKVLTSSGHIETSIHYGVDKTYFPWRPEGNRRLLPDGTFGRDLETTDVMNLGKMQSKFQPSSNPNILEEDDFDDVIDNDSDEQN